MKLPNSNCVFQDSFSGPVETAKLGGSLTGSPVYKNGLVLDGSTQYATYQIPNTLFAHPEISIVVEFTPDFDWDDGNVYFLFDSTSGGRYILFKEATSKLTLYLGNTEIASILGATFSPYWLNGEKNIVVISGETGSTNLWLNGNRIITNDVTAWTPKQPVELKVGGSNTNTAKFDGTIHSFSIHNRLFTQEDVSALQNNSLFNYSNKADVWLDFKSLSDNVVTDKSGKGNNFTNVGGSFLAPGILTDGNDYLQSVNSGILDTSIDSFSVVCVADKGRNQGSRAFVSYEETGLTNSGFLVLSSTGGWQFYAGGVSGVNAANYTDSNFSGPEIVVGTTTGTETSIWVNGNKGTNAINPLVLKITTEQILTLLSRVNGTTSAVLDGGKVYFVALIPFKLSPIQVSHITSFLMSEYH